MVPREEVVLGESQRVESGGVRTWDEISRGAHQRGGKHAGHGERSTEAAGPGRLG